MTRSLTRGYRWGLQSAAQIPLAILFGITAGYREEFFFRSYLLGRLEELGVGSLAVAASTALFAAVMSTKDRWRSRSPRPSACSFPPPGCDVAASTSWQSPTAHTTRAVLCLGLVLPHALPEAAAVHIFHPR